MRVLLINENRSKENIIPYPLGLAYVASAARKAGHDVRCLDLMFCAPALKQVEEEIRDFNPDIVGVSVRNIDNQEMNSTIWYIPEVDEIIRTVKHSTDSPVVLGGAGFSIFPLECLDHFDVSLGIAGDGEIPFVELLDCLKKGNDPLSIPGVALRDRERAVLNPPRYGKEIETLPLPDRNCPDVLNYRSTPFEEPAFVANIQSRRGCHMKCIYCSSPTIEGKRIRTRDPKSVARELEILEKDYGVRIAAFTDSLFNFPGEYTRNICEEILKRKLSIRWLANINPRFHERELTQIMAKAGCVSVSIGNESGCDYMLERLGKGFSKSEIEDAVRDAHSSGIRVNCFMLLGGPGESWKSVRESIELMDELEPDSVRVTVGIRIFPRCGIYEIALKQGFISPGQNLLYPRFYIDPEVSDWLYDLMVDICSERPGWLI